MIKTIFNDLKTIDKKIISVMLNGFKFSLIISLLSVYILALYSTYPFSHVAYLSGLLLFKLSLTCTVAFFVCGFAVDKMR